MAETLVGPQLPNLPTIISVPLVGSFGVNAAFGINLGLNTRVTDFNVGTIDVNLPIDYSITVPDEIRPGEQFTISTGYSIGAGAGFNATTNAARLDLRAKSGLLAQLGVDVCFISCFVNSSTNGSFVNVNEPFGTLDLITKTAGQTIINVNVPGFGQPTFNGEVISLPSAIDLNRPLETAVSQVTNVSGELRIPKHVVTGVLDGNVLTSVHTDVFTDINIDLDGFTPLGKVLGNTVTISNFTAG